jgi:hypothetical protein
VIDNFGMIALEGLDCDMASLMSSGDGKYLLYIVNAKFVPGLKEEYGPQKCLKPGITWAVIPGFIIVELQQIG